MGTESWAIVGTILGSTLAILSLGWRAYASLDLRLSGVEQRLSGVEQRLARIEGWIAGRFREESV